MTKEQYYTYVLYSQKYDKIYIGYSSDVEKRLLWHNQLSKNGWTIRYRPWEVLFYEMFLNKRNAMLREKQLKSSRGRAYIWELVKEKFL